MAPIQDCLARGDDEAASKIIADILESFNPPKNTLFAEIASVPSTLERIESEFTRIISLREQQHGIDHIQTIHAKVAFAGAMLQVLELHTKDDPYDHDTALHLLERSRGILYPVFQSILSEEWVEVLLPSYPTGLGHGLPDPWTDYDFVGTVLPACRQSSDIFHALILSEDYKEQARRIEIQEVLDKGVRAGLFVEIVVSTSVLAAVASNP